jgi:hypothetical protein
MFVSSSAFKRPYHMVNYSFGLLRHFLSYGLFVYLLAYYLACSLALHLLVTEPVHKMLQKC